ncbi:ATP-binding cassette domain-containing protein [Bacillus hwajinpoensis]|uniref:ATP-binding cassette domain-containing protein n=1 Tax=Guptibacillus hwajinpoensis TaxID=208199 RepID=A0A845EQA5_9BACL|nr:ABC transporter ATP-binding protein [Pseudalkalibacillus hwajinpoensis]MYL61839.1 ATP-binding cassette domain-containing protein [Pseudalkalibacillus hwajinpoensis]
MAVKPVVQIRDLTKVIGKKTIIDQLSFDVYPGEVFGFLGPNGAGKTTTIRMMVGLMRMTEGEVLIDGSSIKTDYENAIVKVGAIVENPEMYKFLTGYQNLVHYARMVKGISKERIQEVIQLVGLQGRIHEKVKGYSLGMRQRLGLAQALLHRPRLLILDEPTNGLDPAGIREIRQYLRTLAREENVAVVVSSHLLSEIELMCDRIGIIQAGKMIDVQRVNDFVQNDQAVMVSFEVDPVEHAVHAVKVNFPDCEIEQADRKLTIKIEHELIPEVTAVLVEKGVRVYGIQSSVKTLEDVFLEVTGGEQVV